MKIKFCGAAREVTGSAHLITLDSGYTILLDCGMFQGNEKESKISNETFPFDPEKIDCLILSHAHIDHCGRIPKLVKEGFIGNIISTPATRDLALIMLLDSAKIQESDAKYEEKLILKKKKMNIEVEPLYNAEDVYTALSQFITVPYERKYRINENVILQFRDAGHILGSASVYLEVTEDGKTKTLGFTADIGRPSRPILRDPQQMEPVDYLLCESTYGSRHHESLPNEYDKLLSIIKKTCVEQRGKLIIPAFSLGRTQEIVYMLDRMHNSKLLPKIPVYVDSPLSVNATRIFRLHPECYDEELREYIQFDPDPYGFNGLKYVTDTEDSKLLNDINVPCIIISASGMANAGRIRHHIFNSIGNHNNTILIVGYCAPGTLGAILKQGIEDVLLFGERKLVRASIEVMDSFSAHADQKELYDFIQNQQASCKSVYLVHGQLDSQLVFKDFLLEKGFNNIEIPSFGEEFYLT